MTAKAPARPIMLVDDSHEDLFLTKRLLTRAGVKHPIVTVDSGAEAIAFLRAASLPAAADLKPVVVFSDVKMPGVDGFDLLRWARQQKALARVPFVLLSGGNHERDRERAEELGASDYLVKFPTPEVFAKIIRAADA